MSQLRVDSIRANDGTDTTEVSIPSLDRRFAAAYLNFAGNTLALRQQYNISSVTQGGTGDFTITLDEPMADTGYLVDVCSTSSENSFTVISETQFRVFTLNSSGTATNPSQISVIVFGE